MEDFLALGGNPTHEAFGVLAVRLAVAAVLGALIGFEREIKKHPNTYACIDGRGGIHHHDVRNLS